MNVKEDRLILSAAKDSSIKSADFNCVKIVHKCTQDDQITVGYVKSSIYALCVETVHNRTKITCIVVY